MDDTTLDPDSCTFDTVVGSRAPTALSEKGCLKPVESNDGAVRKGGAAHRAAWCIDAYQPQSRGRELSPHISHTIIMRRRTVEDANVVRAEAWHRTLHAQLYGHEANPAGHDVFVPGADHPGSFRRE